MRNDTAWKAFLSDRERFADLANAFIPGTGGTVCAADIREMDTQAGHIREPGSRKQVTVQILAFSLKVGNLNPKAYLMTAGVYTPEIFPTT